MTAMTKFAIIENESLARIELENSMTDLRPQWNCAGYAESIEEAVALIDENPDIDLIFMDIELDDGQCFEIFDKCDIQAAIIFTTAYSDYALRAFHLNSLDYLLKPFNRDNLNDAIKKFEKFSTGTEKAAEEHPAKQEIPAPHSLQKEIARILIQEGDNYSFLKLEDIAWFFSEDKYIFCITNSGKQHFTGFKSLNELEMKLPNEDFFRLRRNVIASVASIVKVSKFHKGSLLVALKANTKEETIVVNQKNKTDFLAWLGLH